MRRLIMVKILPYPLAPPPALARTEREGMRHLGFNISAAKSAKFPVSRHQALMRLPSHLRAMMPVNASVW